MKCVYCLLLIFIVGTLGHPMFMDLIPNGHFVPNPCGSGFWNAVGHYKPMTHTVQKNPFGMEFKNCSSIYQHGCESTVLRFEELIPEAFKASGFTWTQALCLADSDGDGRTNGEELGDPKCVWQPHAQPSANATGHPGICEPLDSATCRNTGFSCGCQDPSCFG